MFGEGVMSDRFGFRLAVGIVVLAAVAAVGFYSYNLGLAHGIAESGRAIAVPGGSVPLVAVWPRPWGFGFGFFPFFPLFFILFWVFVLRGMFWRRGWRGRRYGYDGVPPAFEEWHRRAHADQKLEVKS
jgi:hypothetical protein